MTFDEIFAYGLIGLFCLATALGSKAAADYLWRKW